MKKMPKKSTPKTKVSSEIYREKFLKIISKASRPLRQCEIVDIFEKERNCNPITDVDYVSRSAIQSSASRELPKLVADKKIILIDEKFYQIYTREDERAKIRKKILEEILFTGDSVYEITDKVWAIQVEKSSLTKAERLFKEYLAEYCFDVTAIRKMIIIMLSCRKQYRDNIQLDLSALLTEYQENKSQTQR